MCSCFPRSDCHLRYITHQGGSHTYSISPRSPISRRKCNPHPASGFRGSVLLLLTLCPVKQEWQIRPASLTLSLKTNLLFAVLMNLFLLRLCQYWATSLSPVKLRKTGNEKNHQPTPQTSSHLARVAEDIDFSVLLAVLISH